MEIMDILLVALLALTQILDAWTTYTVLKRGGRELNPLMQAAFDEFGVKTTLVLKGIAVTGAGIICIDIGQDIWAWVIVIVYTMVVGWNLKELKK